MKGFASDNYSGAHNKIIEAITRANINHAGAYGNDEYTEKAVSKFKEIFGNNIDVYFVYSGTGANVLSLKTVTNSFNAIICADVAHINVDETGAPEQATGCKLLTIPTTNGKINVSGIKKYMHRVNDEHFAQPKVISITQPTELGTLYTVDEIKEISTYAKQQNLLLHMDGARISNAAAAMNLNFKDFTKNAGVDILSFGGTKNGLLFGEAVIFFNKELSQNFKFYRKQAMQLASKMRFISAQFEALLTNNLWKENAENANKMAQYLYTKLKNIKEITITQKVETNGVFAIIPKELALKLQKETPFYFWDEEKSEVRFMLSFDNTKVEIDKFVELINLLIGK
jgi:threonine aldolase